MALSAFHADAGIRRDALRRLAVCIDLKRLVAGPLAWDGANGSVVGCLIESTDPQVWQQRLGLARWLAHALDAVTDRQTPAQALQTTSAWLQALPPGCDTGPVGCKVVCGLLDEVVAAERPLPAPLQQAFDAVHGLHQRSLAGETIDAAAWKAARGQAVAATDTFDAANSPQAHAVGAAIESAAWDPQRSAMAVAEVLRLWLDLQGLDANRESDWTEADDAHVQSLLGRMHEEHISGKPQETRDVFQLLEQHHPDDAARLRAHLKVHREHGARSVARAADVMAQLLHQAT